MTSCKKRTSVVQILKHETSIDIRVHHVSHDTFGAQFLIGRTPGEGGQVAFLRTYPQKSMALKRKLK